MSLDSASLRARARALARARVTRRQGRLALALVPRRAWRRLACVASEDEILAYARATVELAVQRQVIYAATLVLSIAYYDASFGILCYLLNFTCDVLELRWARRVQAEGQITGRRLRQCCVTVVGFTLASSAAISFFVIGTASIERSGGHFTPLFFLLAAAIFATMNNHQVMLALAIRLVFYGSTFLIVPALDLWRDEPPLGSVQWLHFFTSVFVLFFILDSARVFLGLHRDNVRQLGALRAAEARALRSLRLQTQFISVVSHELRTPLTSINGAIGLARSGRLGTPPPALAQLLDVASRNGKRLASLVNDVLDLQKLAAGEMRFETQRVDLDALVSECVEANACLSQDVRLVHLRATGGPRRMAVADPHRLMQVLSNVVSNAVKFSPPGASVEIETHGDGTAVGIRVRDRGRGIPPGSEDLVFGRFTQVDSSDRREKQGTGLGMNIARQIMAAFGGTIGYESELGRGTVFHIDLPAAGAGAEEVPGPVGGVEAADRVAA